MVDEAQLARYGELVARLARPLSDRAAVLWLLRLDERQFRALECRCLATLAREPHACAAFSRAYARTTALLSEETDVAPPSPSEREGSLQPLPTRSDLPAAQPADLALQTETVPIGNVPVTGAAASLDPADAMFTLPAATEAAPQSRSHKADDGDDRRR